MRFVLFLHLLLHHRRVYTLKVCFFLYTHIQCISIVMQLLRIALILLVHTSFSIHSIFHSLNDLRQRWRRRREYYCGAVLRGEIKNLFSITLNCDTLNVVVNDKEGGKPQITLMEIKSLKIMIIFLKYKFNAECLTSSYYNFWFFCFPTAVNYRL